MSMTIADGDLTAEILQHRIRWHLKGETAPEDMPEELEQHIEAMIKDGYNQGELIHHEGDDMLRGWWSIDND